MSEGFHNATVYYGWQYLGTNNPSSERYEVTAYATVDFVVGNPRQTGDSVSKPSIPDFAVRLRNSKEIELTIRNQPFDKDNIYNYSFVYNVRIKTRVDNWTDLYNAEDGYPHQSDSDYTVLSYVLGESAYYPPEDYPLSPSVRVGILPTEGQVDFQVQAMIGHRDRGVYSLGIMPYVFKGEESGWSDTQTITISDSPPQTAEPFPTTSIILIVQFVVVATIVLVVLISAALLVYFKKTQSLSKDEAKSTG